MRALKAAVAVMGVLIVVGVVTLAVLLAQRTMGPGGGPGTSAVLDEPAGTRIVSVTALPDRFLVQLQGGGPDRLVVLDARSSRVLGHVALAR